MHVGKSPVVPCAPMGSWTLFVACGSPELAKALVCLEDADCVVLQELLRVMAQAVHSGLCRLLAGIPEAESLTDSQSKCGKAVAPNPTAGIGAKCFPNKSSVQPFSLHNVSLSRTQAAQASSNGSSRKQPLKQGTAILHNLKPTKTKKPKP